MICDQTFIITPKKEFTNITSLIQSAIDDQGLKEGLCIVYSKHTTACIGILEDEKLLMNDMHNFLEFLSPSGAVYQHDDIEHRTVPPEERRNGHSHLRAMLLNHQQTIPVIDYNLDLGKWQKLFYIETDLGKEDRTYSICFIS